MCDRRAQQTQTICHRIAAALWFLIAALAVGCSDERGESLTAAQFSKLSEAVPSEVAPDGELSQLFALGSRGTDLQRENKLREINGKVVEWILPVYEVSREGAGYKIQTGNPLTILFRSRNTPVDSFVYISPRNKRDHDIVASLKTGDEVAIKGIIAGTSSRSIEIHPAILVSIENARKAKVDRDLRSILSCKDSIVTLDEDGSDTIAYSRNRQTLLIVSKDSQDRARDYARALHIDLSRRMPADGQPLEAHKSLQLFVNGKPFEYAHAEILAIEGNLGPGIALFIEFSEEFPSTSVECNLLNSDKRKYEIKLSTDAVWASWSANKIVRQPANLREKCP